MDVREIESWCKELDEIYSNPRLGKFIKTIGIAFKIKEIWDRFQKSNDEVYARQLRRLADILREVQKSIEEQNVLIGELDEKFADMFVEHASWGCGKDIDSNELLKKKWAELLVSAISDPENDMNTPYVNILHQLSILEVRILDFLYKSIENVDNYLQEEEVINKAMARDENQKMTLKIFVETNVISQFKLIEERFEIILDHLIQLRLFKRAQLKGSLSQGDFRAIIEGPNGFRFTALGLAFCKACGRGNND